MSPAKKKSTLSRSNKWDTSKQHIQECEVCGYSHVLIKIKCPPWNRTHDDCNGLIKLEKYSTGNGDYDEDVPGMKHRVTAVEKFVHPSLRESGKNDPPPPRLRLGFRLFIQTILQ